jgi:hypothetical protein
MSLSRRYTHRLGPETRGPVIMWHTLNYSETRIHMGAETHITSAVDVDAQY